MKKFFRFMLFISIVVIIVFCVLFVKNEVISLIYSQTGTNIHDVSLDGAGKENTSVKIEFVEIKDDGKQSDELGELEKYIAGLEGNVVIGINYSGISNDPAILSVHSDRIIKVKVKAVKTVAYSNVVYSEITARVKKTYKGQETDEIQIHAFGGALNTADLKDGQIKETVGKSAETGDKVNVLVDFCDWIEEGKEYIIFANNNNGILSPVNGNMSFFKIDGRNVKRLSSNDNDFSMKLSKFEKEYLE